MDAEVPGISVPAAVIAARQGRRGSARGSLRAGSRTGASRPRAAGRARAAPHLVPQGRRGRALVRAARHSPNQGARREWTRFCSRGLGPSRSAIDKPFCIIGERINPTGRKAFAQELRDGNLDQVIEDADAQIAMGADMLDVNAGIPLVDEAELLAKMIRLLQDAHRHPALHRLLGDRGARGRARRLRGQGARQLRHRRGRPPRADPADRRQARRGRDRPHERRDGHPRDRRAAAR